MACITRWDGGSSLASKSAAPIFPLSPVNFFFLLNFTKKSELYYKPATGGLDLQLLSSSRLGNLTAAHGWKVGAGNGPDVWGLEGELGGEVELLLLPLVVVGGHGGSHRVRGRCTRHQAGPQAMSSVSTCTLPGFERVNHQE